MQYDINNGLKRTGIVAAIIVGIVLGRWSLASGDGIGAAIVFGIASGVAIIALFWAVRWIIKRFRNK